MASGVVIREVDVIKAYERRLTNFGGTIRDRARWLEKDIKDSLYRLSGYQGVMEKVLKDVNSDLLETQYRLKNLMNQEEKNERLIRDCQERVDKLSLLSTKASESVEMGKQLYNKYRTISEELEGLTERFSNDVDEHIERGSAFLEKVIYHADKYKSITI